MQDYKNIQEGICELLHWDAGQYANHVYETGLAYIRCLPGVDELTAMKMERSATFWAWFKTYRARLDDSLLSHVILNDMRLQTIREIYDAIHYPDALAMEIKPNRIVWESVKPL